MSHYVPKLREEDGRDGTQWPIPPGTWKQQDHVSHLATFAEKLDVSKGSMDTDLLNSVPTPWARLLLFENALFDERHPSHRDIVKQWRGLLGVLALARPLGLKLEASTAEMTIRLSEMAASAVAKTFLDLRPEQFVGDDEALKSKWDAFQMIAVDGVVIGATSPRTLVFTGVAHNCPPSIPFQTLQGKLSDPLAYYKKYGDKRYLALLDQWVSGIITNIQAEPRIGSLLGTIPKPEGTTQPSRVSLVGVYLQEWQKEIKAELKGSLTEKADGEPVMIFGLQPYRNIIRGLPSVNDQRSVQSDLLLKGRKSNVVVCYRPEENSDKDSRLFDHFGNPIQNEPLKIYDGWWHDSDRPLPNPLNFLPGRLNVEIIDDPVAQLFEDDLIQVNLPQITDSVYALKLGSGNSHKTYLFPFKSKVLEYLSPDVLAQSTTITSDDSKRTIRIELRIPLVDERTILASREYSFTSNVVVGPATAQLAAWPNFASPSWRHYFYFKRSVADPEVDFKPVTGELPRKKGVDSWYRTENPSEAFIGTINNKSGLLLVRYEDAEAVNRHWKVGVDFGSTHTRAFSLPVVQIGENEYKPNEGAVIEPILFGARARQLTSCGQATLDANFFATSGRLDPPTRQELKSLLMTPIPMMIEEEQDWLPREGFVYLHWLFESKYDENRIKDNIKWEGNRTKYDLRAFLRCLLTMLQAEAVSQGAKIVSVARAFPSAFTATLEQEHNEEWSLLGQFMGLDISDEGLSEAVATCRYLEYEERAPVMSSAISIDVGGSTSDIAIWAGKSLPGGKPKAQLEIQESVKIAAGIVGRFLQSPGAEGFLKRFEQKMRSYQEVGENLDLNSFAGTRSGYALLFYNLLSYLELGGPEKRQQLRNIIEWIKKADDIEDNGNLVLLSHVIFLFSGLIYYMGVLARKVGLLERPQNTYYLYFCGKGGTLIRWIQNYEELAQQMFEAGLFGPQGRNGRPTPAVTVRISQKPKEEVGRGLLAKSALEANPRDDGIGLVDLKDHSVTVGESGYEGLEWSGNLNAQSLAQLPLHVPKMADLTELQNFIQAFKENTRTTFDFNKVDAAIFQDQLQQRLFVRNRGDKESDILVEPLFISELKVLQEILADNDKLFD